MADISPSTAPALQSTADPTPYVPVSWMAVAAVTVAGLFAFLLLLLGISAFINKKPLLMPELLVLPAIAIVLSFAARRMIRNSEGTRTGENLALTAWWLSLVLGLGYIAYLFAIDFSVRKDAENEVIRWVNLVRDDKEDKLPRAFHRTLAPGTRQGVGQDDWFRMRALFANPTLTFETSDFVRLVQRNKGECDFTPTGLKDWSYKPGMIDCVYTGKIVCPEGTFPIQVQLKGFEGVTEAGGGRQWMVVLPQSGVFIAQDQVTRTPYGWLLLLLEVDGAGFAKEFVGNLAGGATLYPYLYRGYIEPKGNKQTWATISGTTNLRIAIGGGLGIGVPHGTGYTDYMEKQFFRLPRGANPTDAQRDAFLKNWYALGAVPAGTRLKDQSGNIVDKENIITVTDTAVEVRFPLELPLLGTAGKLESARGRLVVQTTDKELLDELKQLRAAADPAKGTAEFPEQLRRRKPVPWRVVRIESDLAPVSVAPQGGPGGPGGPGPDMMGGPG